MTDDEAPVRIATSTTAFAQAQEGPAGDDGLSFTSTSSVDTNYDSDDGGEVSLGTLLDAVDRQHAERVRWPRCDTKSLSQTLFSLGEGTPYPRNGSTHFPLPPTHTHMSSQRVLPVSPEFSPSKPPSIPLPRLPDAPSPILRSDSRRVSSGERDGSRAPGWDRAVWISQQSGSERSSLRSSTTTAAGTRSASASTALQALASSAERPECQSLGPDHHTGRRISTFQDDQRLSSATVLAYLGDRSDTPASPHLKASLPITGPPARDRIRVPRTHVSSPSVTSLDRFEELLALAVEGSSRDAQLDAEDELRQRLYDSLASSRASPYEEDEELLNALGPLATQDVLSSNDEHSSPWPPLPSAGTNERDGFSSASNSNQNSQNSSPRGSRILRNLSARSSVSYQPSSGHNSLALRIAQRKASASSSGHSHQLLPVPWSFSIASSHASTSSSPSLGSRASKLTPSRKKQSKIVFDECSSSDEEAFDRSLDTTNSPQPATSAKRKSSSINTQPTVPTSPRTSHLFAFTQLGEDSLSPPPSASSATSSSLDSWARRDSIVTQTSQASSIDTDGHAIQVLQMLQSGSVISSSYIGDEGRTPRISKAALPWQPDDFSTEEMRKRGAAENEIPPLADASADVARRAEPLTGIAKIHGKQGTIVQGRSAVNSRGSLKKPLPFRPDRMHDTVARAKDAILSPSAPPSPALPGRPGFEEGLAQPAPGMLSEALQSPGTSASSSRYLQVISSLSRLRGARSLPVLRRASAPRDRIASHAGASVTAAALSEEQNLAAIEPPGGLEQGDSNLPSTLTSHHVRTDRSKRSLPRPSSFLPTPRNKR